MMTKQDYYNVFQHSMNYPNSFKEADQHKFNFKQHDEIEPAIERIFSWLKRYEHEHDDFGELKEEIKIYIVACMPFLMAKFY